MNKTKKKFKKIYVEIINSCNLNCSFCPDTHRAKAVMTLEQFGQIADQVAPLTDLITFHIKGEPLMHPQLGAFLERAQLSALKVNITTNGWLIQETQKQLLGQKALRQMNFSLHSLEEVHQVSALKDYLMPILDFATTASKQGIIISLRIWNYEKQSQEMKGNVGNIMALLQDYFQLEQPIPLFTLAHQGHKLAPHIYLNQDEIFEWPDLQAPNFGTTGSCYGLRHQLGILVDGTVVPCCLDHEGIIDLGNLFEQPLTEILNTERAKTIEEGFCNQKIQEELCQKCGYRQRFSAVQDAHGAVQDAHGAV